MTTEYDVQVSSGNAAKLATDLTVHLFAGVTPDVDSVVQVWSDLHQRIARRLVDNTADLVATTLLTQSFGATPIQHEQPAPQAQYQPAPQQGFQPQAQPAPAPTGPASPFPAQPQYVAPPQPQQAVAQPAPAGGYPGAIPAQVYAQPAPAPAPVPGVGGADDPETVQAIQLLLADLQSGQFANNWYDNRTNKKSANSADFTHKTMKQANGRFKVGVWLNGKKNPAWAYEAFRQAGLVA